MRLMEYIVQNGEELQNSILQYNAPTFLVSFDGSRSWSLSSFFLPNHRFRQFFF